jgi:hypothetical protein
MCRDVPRMCQNVTKMCQICVKMCLMCKNVPKCVKCAEMSKNVPRCVFFVFMCLYDVFGFFIFLNGVTVLVHAYAWTPGEALAATDCL